MKSNLEIHQSIIKVSGLELSLYSFKRSLLGIKSAKPKLLCLHGGPGLGSLSIWPGFSELSEIFDLIFMDLRGCGLSEDPADGDYSLEAYAQDISTLVAQIKGDSEIGLFGHSFGGSVVLKTLALYPALFNFGIVCNSPYETQWQVQFSERAATEFPELNAAGGAFFSNLTDAGFKEFLMSFGRMYFPEIPLEKSQSILSQWNCRVQPYLFASTKILSQMDLREECKSIKVPCLVIASQLDPLIPPAFGKDLASILPHGQYALIENAGHFPFLTRTPEFTHAVINWTGKLSLKGIQSA